MFTTALLIPGSEPGIAASDESQSKLLYFRTLHVNPIKANVSFATDALRDDKKEVRLLLLLFFFLLLLPVTRIISFSPGQENVISNLIKTGGLLPNVENAPLILNGLLFKVNSLTSPHLDYARDNFYNYAYSCAQNPFLTREDLWDMMTKHYKSATIEQVLVSRVSCHAEVSVARYFLSFFFFLLFVRDDTPTCTAFNFDPATDLQGARQHGHSRQSDLSPEEPGHGGLRLLPRAHPRPHHVAARLWPRPREGGLPRT